MNKVRSLSAALRLVFPPISNQEAIWLLDDPETVQILKSSDFYMIAQRAEALFGAWETVESGERLLVKGSLSLPHISETFELDVFELLSQSGAGFAEHLVFEFGDKVMKVFESRNGEETLLEYFTTEKLIHERGHLRPGIRGLDSVREFATYELLYVGISKKNSTFQRLIHGSHEARQKILGERYALRPGSRVTDEVYLFAFDIEHFRLRTLDDGDTLGPRDGAEELKHDVRVTADAEKAFIKLLDPEYNEEKYLNYPRGADGLFETGLTGYGFQIQENMTFRTKAIELIGAVEPRWLDGISVGLFSKQADVIVIRGDDVTVIAGTDAI
jgi:hypothetical protein